MNKSRKQMSVLLAAVMVFTMIATGCTSSSQTTTTSSTTTSTTSSGNATSSDELEIVTMAIISTWDTLNIYNVSGNYGHCVADQMFERMVTVTHDGEYEPRLANSWEMSDDHTSITFYLNENSTWHDGEAVTAEDAVFTLQAVTNEQVDNYYRSQFAILAGTDDTGICADASQLGAEALDTYTLKLTFKTPKDITTILSSFCSYFYILPQHILDSDDLSSINTSDYWSAPIGCGPFIYEDDIAGEELELVANESYYLGAPDFDKLVIRVIPAASLTVGLLNGEIDVVGAGSIPLADWETIQAADNLVSASVSTYSYQYMQFNLSDEAEDFQNANIRVAFDMAINKQMIVDNLMYGEGQVAVGPMPTYHPYYNDDLVGNSYDPDGAKALLESNGFDFSKTYRLIVPSGNQVREQSALVIQQNLADIGVTVTIETYEFATLLEMMRNGDFDLGLLGGGSNIDPAESAVIVKPGSAQNYSLVTDSTWYDLAEIGSALVDFDERKDAFDEYQAALVEDQPYIWLYHQNNLWAYSDRFESIPQEDFIWYNYKSWTWKLAD